MAERRIAFIINPKAGTRKKIDVPEFIRNGMPKGADYEIFIWEKVDAFDEIAENVLSKNFNVAAAVGGDGTVNRVASMVNGSNVALGILPFGSGNGLARSIGVKMDINLALEQIVKGTIKTVDSASINGVPFFCTAGTGFDAHIGKLFAESKTRGFNTYFKITTRELFRYKPMHYEIAADGIITNVDAFLITACNAGQWGNDVFICPAASMTDGLLHLTVLKPFPKYKLPGIARKLFRRTIDESAYIETFTGKKFVIHRESVGPAHYDGEPVEMGRELVLEVHPDTLKVVS